MLVFSLVWAEPFPGSILFGEFNWIQFSELFCFMFFHFLMSNVENDPTLVFAKCHKWTFVLIWFSSRDFILMFTLIEGVALVNSSYSVFGGLYFHW